MRLRNRDNLLAGVIEVFDDAISNTEEITAYLKRKDSWNPARIGVGEGEAILEKRNNKVTFFDPLAFTCPDVLRKFAGTVWNYLDDYAKRYDVTFMGMENVNVNRYEPGEYYVAHADDGIGQSRIISALVYLNNVEEGGQTEFIYQNVSVYPKAGRLVIFPSNYAYSHAAHPPTSGVKYSAAFWTVK
jgi:hypothetical protein